MHAATSRHLPSRGHPPTHPPTRHSSSQWRIHCLGSASPYSPASSATLQAGSGKGRRGGVGQLLAGGGPPTAPGVASPVTRLAPPPADAGGGGSQQHGCAGLGFAVCHAPADARASTSRRVPCSAGARCTALPLGIRAHLRHQCLVLPLLHGPPVGLQRAGGRQQAGGFRAERAEQGDGKPADKQARQRSAGCQRKEAASSVRAPPLCTPALPSREAAQQP